MNTIISNTSSTQGATGNGASVSLVATTTPASTPIAPASPPAGKAKVTTGFLSRASSSQLSTEISRVVTSMTGNPAFPTPNPSLATISAALGSFQAAVTAAHDSRIARTTRTQQRAGLCSLVRTLALYVDVASAGDLPTLLSSGFTAQRGRTPVGPLSAPENVRLVRGKVSGQAIARCSKVAQATAYQWRCAPVATPTAWLPVTTTAAAHHLFAGLTPATAYLAQVCVVGTAGPSNWSESATVTVL